jgi:hypothetical protein
MTDQSQKKVVVYETKVGKTIVQFVHGSVFSMNNESILVPVIHKNNDLEIDTDVLTELKSANYQ